MIPIFILQTWLLGFLSMGIIAGAVYFGNEWQRRSWGWDPVQQKSIFIPHLAWNLDTALLAAACFLVLIALFGGTLVKVVLRAMSKKRPEGEPDPHREPRPTLETQITRPDGSILRVKFYGPEEGIPIVVTHGWSLHSSEWNNLARSLSDKFRVITWDEPGLGESTRPNNRDYSIENLAMDLKAVLDLAGNQPAILLGHSIGGMIILTFCRLFPAMLESRLMGLVLTHTTYTNPVRTTSGAAFYSAIEKPILVPMMYLTIALSPWFWVLSWLSYWNGSAHLSTKRGSFAGTETWEEIDFATRFQLTASPAVLARGMLGMMAYDATHVLPQITVPTLIVAGDRDTTTKPEASAVLRAGIPNARLVTLTPAKHLGLIEHHEKYAEEVREFAHLAHALSVRAALAPAVV